jgi:7-cyano-7-deazaguanine synthase in queuosine biosynthesis
MVQDIPDVLVDLLEIATYVFAADQSLWRGSEFDTGERWRRQMEFRIPVRLPEIWSRTAVREALVETLSFLTDDDYRFQFTKQRQPVPVQGYLELAEAEPKMRFDQVQLFSGGVDSLAGAIQAAIHEEKSVMLVGHRSAAKRVPATAALYDRLRLAAPSRVHRVSVWATTLRGTSREYTQRSRSFLYASLAATVASVLGLDSIAFYENGVTSMNLPISPQVVGARATRTTHPQTLRGFERIFSAVFGKPFTVRSPFFWKTKADVMKLVVSHDTELLPLSISCSRTIAATVDHPHCGTCSQCVDRRLAALALHLGDDADPGWQYKVDVLTGALEPGEDRTMAESFVQRARMISSATDGEFFARFPEASRILNHTDLPSNEAATRLLDLHRRHAGEVREALSEGIKSNAGALESGSLPDSCLLALTLPEKYKARAPETGGTHAPDRPSLVYEGATWRIWFASESATIKDSQGVKYLVRLLTNPGQQFSSLDLAGLLTGGVPDGISAAAVELTDRGSIVEYRRRAEELPEEISSAESQGDPERLLELKEELRAIRAHLSKTTRLGGKPRRAPDAAERARKAVRIAIERVIQEIEQRNLHSLGRHLRSCLTRGHACIYRPVPPVTWHVQASLS